MSNSTPRGFSRPRWPRLNSVTVSALVLLAALGVTGALFVASSPPPVPQRATQYLTLDVLVSPGTGHAYFAPGNFTLSSETPVEVTIENFDTSAAVASPMATQVRGVTNGEESVTFAPGANVVQVTSLGSNDVSHTFSISAGQLYNVNVPIPPAAAPGRPSVVQFTLYLSHPGTFTWWCSAVCGQMPMGLGGGMAGVIVVTS